MHHAIHSHHFLLWITPTWQSQDTHIYCNILWWLLAKHHQNVSDKDMWMERHTDVQREKTSPSCIHFIQFSFSLSWQSTCKVSTDCLLHSTHQLLHAITSSVRSQRILPFPKPEFAASRMFFMLRKTCLACATVSPATNLFVLGSIPITPDKYTVLSITTAWLQ